MSGAGEVMADGSTTNESARVRRWRWLPLTAFLLIVVMSIVAVFLTQHLKAAKPVLWSNPVPPVPVPATFSPTAGKVCKSGASTLDYRQTAMTISPTNSDTIAVSVVPMGASDPVATLSPGVPVAFNARHTFVWNGREASGSLAPAGSYFFRVVLQNLGRTINFTWVPVKLVTSGQVPAGGCPTS